jgi:NTE family protein
MFWPFKNKIGLVLGGGVARGIAHIGVLKVLEEYKIPIEYIAAVSSGALMGTAYAAGMDLRLVEEIAFKISWAKLVRLAFFRPGFASTAAIKEMVIKYIGDKDFSELKIPFAVVAVDLKSGEPVAINKGKVAKAVAASSAFPAIFSPEEVDNRFLVDGGIGNNLPVDVARKMGADYVIAVNIIPSRPVRDLPRDPFQVFGRSLDIVLNKLSAVQRASADLLIEPEIQKEDIWHLDRDKAKRLISAGEAAARQALETLRRT